MLMKWKLFALTALTWSVPSHPANYLPNAVTRLSREIEQRVTNERFMGSVLVAEGDHLLINRGFGFANIEWAAVNGPATKFRVGSITKQFTAASILLLKERGKLQLDDHVSKYVANSPAAWNEITITHLLTHTSGIPNYTEFSDDSLYDRAHMSPARLIMRFRDKPLEFAPGSSWHYSNSGYVLLGYIIEKITGDSYANFIQKNIFTPLGMLHSGYDSNSQIIVRHAEGYALGPQGLQVAPYVQISSVYSAGGLYSTTADLLRWEQGLFGGKLLSASSLAQMTLPATHHYALGLEIDSSKRGDTIVRHSGRMDGYNAMLAYVPARRLAVIVLANMSFPAADDVGDYILRVALGEKVVLPSERNVTTSRLDLLTGSYGPAANASLTISREGDHLVAQFINGEPKRLNAESDRDFAVEGERDTRISFKTDAHGKALEVVLHQNDRDSSASRLDDDTQHRIMSALSAINDRFRDQVPTPSSEADLRQFFSGIARANLDYSRMTPALADAVRQSMSENQAALGKLGDLASLTFQSVDSTGAAHYDVTFANGSAKCFITYQWDGLISGFFYEIDR